MTSDLKTEVIEDLNCYLFTIVQDLFPTHRNFSQLLLHLVQFVLLTSSGEKSSGITALHSINLDWGLEENIDRLIVLRGARLAVNLDYLP